MDEGYTGEIKITRKQWKEFQVFKEEYAENERTRNLLLQSINDTLEGNIRSANIKVFPASYVINTQDSLDDSYPLYVHFNILPEMVKIVSIKLSFWFLNFRAYATGAKSGGGSNPTTSDGGSANPTTSDGGGAVPTTSDGGGATPTSSEGCGQTSSYVTTPSGGGGTSGPLSAVTVWIAEKDGDNFVLIQGTTGRYEILGDGAGAIISQHRHSTPNHTHPNHAHTISDHHHTVTIADHNHTVTIADHNHTVTIADHNHTVTIVDHSHDIVYGIHEEENSPKIVPSISRDNGKTYCLPIGSYTKDQELDITHFIETAGNKIIKFTSTTRARLSVQVTIRLDVKAR